MYWAHKIDDTDALDGVGDCYLFTSLAVRIQYNQRGYSKHSHKRVSKRTPKKKDSITIIIIINTSNDKL